MTLLVTLAPEKVLHHKTTSITFSKARKAMKSVSFRGADLYFRRLAARLQSRMVAGKYGLDRS